mmetsp:Transcript_11831/g.13449  ORF Transcript_11831/g.13449 Transcript_11831/m.13449 type:complete len:140 (+) Transcript_11831:19-438(+)|eukprot:CAMPEP_0168342720 /NCGR_PEP_ID=MMETSP0213-20121227/15578_1 /TAXON_ID=151035 /ORGANISM="Euplotes harpa, Strain FSP1.4" /LENGTH=139 /DNA_ID=CAMNT_0008349703 /DNA_START=17 /DNA_END=436 /DNA_ORIENTATION=+
MDLGHLPAETQKLFAQTEKAELLGEEVLELQAFLIELDRKRNSNMECLGAFRRQEVHNTEKYWVNFGSFFIGLPRKNAYKMVEEDQTNVIKLVTQKRNELKAKIRELITLRPNLVDMDPVVQDLLLKEQEEIREEALDE